MPQMPVDENGDFSGGSDIAHDDPQELGAIDGPQNDESEDGDDGDEEVFAVERIVAHKGTGKSLRYTIKWKGYPDSENTEEPLDNLLPDARDVVAIYHKKIGYDPSTSTGKGVKRAKSMNDLKASDSDSPAPKKSKPSAKSVEEDGWTPKQTDWEPFIDEITHLERDPVTDVLIVFIKWKDGAKPKTKVSMDLVYKHCAVAMCKFYENHLKFTHDR